VRPEGGDTLIEVLVALAIIAATATALIGSVLTAITASGEHRALSVEGGLLKSYAENATAVLERQASPGFVDCAVPATYAGLGSPTALPTGYSVAVTAIAYWNSASQTFGSSCTATQAPQLITVTATSPGGIVSGLAFAVRNPS
jgi:type II secretory pathway pseudopilin PulG